jgi:KUP system potassium uptake protein
MRADNHREGGILALLGLVSPRRARVNKWRAAAVVVSLVGATLLHGEGTITPANSVLRAIEGLKIYAPQMEHAVVPLTVVILAVLFPIQRHSHAGADQAKREAASYGDRFYAQEDKKSVPVT